MSVVSSSRTAELVIEDLVTNEVLLKNYCSPMSDHEEDFIDVQSFSNTSLAESLGGAYRAEATDQWIASSTITAKIPPPFDASTSWFKYEELIDDWLDLTELEAGKRRPALKNRSLSETHPCTEDFFPRNSEIRTFSQVFQEYFGTPLHQKSSECFPLEIFLCSVVQREKTLR